MSERKFQARTKNNEDENKREKGGIKRWNKERKKGKKLVTKKEI